MTFQYRLAVAAAVVCLLASCRSDSNPVEPAAGTDSATTAQSARARVQDRGCPKPLPAHEVLTVREGRHVQVREAPGGAVIGTAPDTTSLGAPTTLSVVDRRGCWFGVVNSIAGNGGIGWVRFDVRRLALSFTRRSLHADLSAHLLRIRVGGRVVDKFTVTVGAPATPTPTGRFAVTGAFQHGLADVYGCCAIALSAIQSSLPPDWPGGDEIAIHGWDGLVGQSASNGCLRASDADMKDLLRRVALGEPIFIHA